VRGGDEGFHCYFLSVFSAEQSNRREEADMVLHCRVLDREYTELEYFILIMKQKSST
jgi:hypothetical protein